METGVEASSCGAHLVQRVVGLGRVEESRIALGQRPAQRVAHALELQADRRRDVNRQSGAVEGGQHPTQPRHRATAHGQRAVSARTAQRQQQLAAALLRDHHRVEAPAAHLLRVAATLADRVADAGEEVRVVVGEPGGAVDAPGLLVGQHDQEEIPRRRHTFALGAQEGADHHRHPVLHVEGAAPPDPALDQLGREGWMGPALVDGGDHIGVALQDQARATPSLQPGDQVRPAGIGPVSVPVDAGFGQQPADVLDTGLFVPRGVGGVEADQLPEQLGGCQCRRSREARKSAATLAACWIVPPAASSSASSNGSSRTTMSCS